MKLAGFIVLLALLFLAARAAGGWFSPVSTVRSPAQYTGGNGSTVPATSGSGGGSNMGGMNMSGNP